MQILPSSSLSRSGPILSGLGHLKEKGHVILTQGFMLLDVEMWRKGPCLRLDSRKPCPVGHLWAPYIFIAHHNILWKNNEIVRGNGKSHDRE